MGERDGFDTLDIRVGATVVLLHEVVDGEGDKNNDDHDAARGPHDVDHLAEK